MIGNALYFVADDEESSGLGERALEVRRHPGRDRRLKDIISGDGDSNPYSLKNINGTLYFAATDSAGTERWKSNGTAAGTTRVKDIVPGAGSSWTGMLAEHGGSLLFTASDATSARELWKSDGTAGGTVLLKDLNPDTRPSTPGAVGVAALDNVAYFYAGQDENALGLELWRSDGTAAGTYRVKDINPGAGGAFSPWSAAPVTYEGALYFATDGVRRPPVLPRVGPERRVGAAEDRRHRGRHRPCQRRSPGDR